MSPADVEDLASVPIPSATSLLHEHDAAMKPSPNSEDGAAAVPHPKATRTLPTSVDTTTDYLSVSSVAKKTKKGRASPDAVLLHETKLANGQLVMWVSESDVRLCTNSLRAVSFKAALSLAQPISRGYASVRQSVEDNTGVKGEFHCACGVPTRLILITHGIGQAMDRTVRDV
jgi:hypothetical protein